MNNNNQKIVLGGGCFWCIEAIYQDLKGVISVTPGYAGGTAENPSYELVCMGKTGHAEVIQLEFNPQIISTEQILKVFFTIHDPTTRNQQGADIGPQYRSIILYSTPEQKTIAEKTITDFTVGHYWPKPIITELQPLSKFYPAEKNHLAYYQNNPDQPYCQIVINPKLQKFRQSFKHLLKTP